MLYLFYITLAVNAHCHSSKCGGFNKDMQHVCRDIGHRSRLHYTSNGPSYSDCPSGYATCQKFLGGSGSAWVCDGNTPPAPTPFSCHSPQCGAYVDGWSKRLTCVRQGARRAVYLTHGGPSYCETGEATCSTMWNGDATWMCTHARPIHKVITTYYVGGPCGNGDSPSMNTYQCGSGLVCHHSGRQGSYGQCQRYSPAPPSPSPSPSGQGQIGDTCGNGPIGFYSCQSGLQCFGAVPPSTYGTCQTPGFPDSDNIPFGGRRLEETKLDEAPGHLEAPQDESRRRGSCFNKCGGFNKDMQHVCRDLGHRSRLHYTNNGPSYFDCPSGWATCQHLQDGWGAAWICDTPPAPSSEYELLTWGSCRGRGMTPILSMEACAEAARNLGLSGQWPQHNWRDEYRPEGCYLYQGYQLWFASNEGTFGRGAETGHYPDTRQPICNTLPGGIGGGRRLEEVDDGETEEQLVELQAPAAEVAQE